MHDQPEARPTPVAPTPPAAAPKIVRAPRPSWSTPPASPAAPAPSPAAGTQKDAALTTLNGDPNGLKQVDLQRALDGALPGLASCFQGSSGATGAGLAFDADPSGRARGIKVTGVAPETERCITNIITGVRLPDFSGNAVPVQFPLTIYKPAPAAASAGAAPSVGNPAGPAASPSGGAGVPAPGAPGIFVKP
jgi:hypothetical protein